MDMNDLLGLSGDKGKMDGEDLLRMIRTLSKINPDLFGKGTQAIMQLVEGYVFLQSLIISLKTHQVSIESKVKSLESRCKTLEGFLAKKAIPDIPGLGDTKKET